MNFKRKSIINTKRGLRLYIVGNIAEPRFEEKRSPFTDPDKAWGLLLRAHQ